MDHRSHSANSQEIEGINRFIIAAVQQRVSPLDKNRTVTLKSRYANAASARISRSSGLTTTDKPPGNGANSWLRPR